LPSIVDPHILVVWEWSLPCLFEPLITRWLTLSFRLFVLLTWVTW
jgi:hypothetical protein